MTESQSLYFLKLVLSLLTQTNCLSTSYVLVSQHLQKQCRKNGRVDYNSPLLQGHRLGIYNLNWLIYNWVNKDNKVILRTYSENK